MLRHTKNWKAARDGCLHAFATRARRLSGKPRPLWAKRTVFLKVVCPSVDQCANLTLALDSTIATASVRRRGGGLDSLFVGNFLSPTLPKIVSCVYLASKRALNYRALGTAQSFWQIGYPDVSKIRAKKFVEEAARSRLCCTKTLPSGVLLSSDKTKTSKYKNFGGSVSS